MFKSIDVKSYIKYSLVSAILYCIPVVFFIRNASYTDGWLLYVGNALFMISIIAFMLLYNRKRKDNASSFSMLIAGHVTTVMGIIIACILAFILLIVFVPGLFQQGHADRVLTDEPANLVRGKTDGLIFMIFANAIFGNISMGSFASIIFAFTVQRDQTKESTAPVERAL